VALPGVAAPYNRTMNVFDVQVCGTGIVGQTLALALARLGLRVALQGNPRPSTEGTPDLRAYALNPASVALLRRLKVWDALPSHAATAVYDMQVQGDAPGSAIEFSAWEQRVGELAWITDAGVLERELATAVRFAPHITPTDRDVDATLVALCEGSGSTRRAALGVDFVRHDYGDRAIAARLVATRPHAGTAHQWFAAPDVLALLPFDTPEPGRSFALVWSVPNDRADALLALDAPAFEAELMTATAGAAGEFKLASDRVAWPLQLGRADRWCGRGWVLLGDAAHVVHPLAGQGLNLGLADVESLARIIEAREPWRPLGDERLLRRYARERAAPTWAMAEATDGLLRLFSHDSETVRELRNRGLNLVNRLPPIKRWLTSRALGN
jgi:2-polyprenyl-6-methoxyphenol hydroxylase-like FAD-dependent oxidoreductase